jgi:hypothetical protein
LRHRLALAALVPVVLALGGMSTAQAAPTSGAPANTHGQCVSESAKAGDQGRSAVAKKKGTCTPPLVCTRNGDVELDSARNTVAVTDVDAPTPEEFGGSSLQCEADLTVVAGDRITFDYTIENGSCGGGIPRIYVVIDGDYYNTFDGNPGQCGVNGTVTYTISVSGTITEVAFVSDRQDGAYSTVTYSNAKIAGLTLNI